MDDPYIIKGNVIVLTGAAGLLGSQYARFLASKGARMVLIDSNDKKLQVLHNELLIKYNSESLPITADITSEKEVINMVKRIKKEYKQIDSLINNAGIGGAFSKKSVKFEDSSLEDWQKTLNVNLTGTYLCSREISKVMLTQLTNCSIINVASTYGLNGPDQRIYLEDDKPTFIKPAVYSTTKGGVIAFTKFLAAYFANSNIRVNTLTPGGVRESSQSEKFIKNYSIKTILGRMAEPDDYNGAILFLVSNASKYMTGANLIIDGGWTAW